MIYRVRIKPSRSYITWTFVERDWSKLLYIFFLAGYFWHRHDLEQPMQDCRVKSSFISKLCRTRLPNPHAAQRSQSNSAHARRIETHSHIFVRLSRRYYFVWFIARNTSAVRLCAIVREYLAKWRIILVASADLAQACELRERRRIEPNKMEGFFPHFWFRLVRNEHVRFVCIVYCLFS